VVLTNPYHKKTGLLMKWIPEPWAWTDTQWEDNIKMDLQEVGWRGLCTGLIWHRIGTGSRHL